MGFGGNTDVRIQSRQMTVWHPSLLFHAAVSTTMLCLKAEAESTNMHTLKILTYLTSVIG